MNKNKWFLIIIVGLSLITGGVLLTGVQTGSNLESVFETIQSRYIKEVEPSKLIEGAIKGMVESLEDPHSYWMDAESFQEIEQRKEGYFEGLGVVITIKNEILTIISPLEGTPASKAGLESGDRIIEINGELTEGITLTEAKEKLRGEAGTTVRLTIQREGEEKPLSFSIVRDTVKFPDVKKELLDEDIGYIKIIDFTNENTAEDLRDALTSLKTEGIKALILDLRGNPGGLFEQGVEVADEFLSQGIIVSTKGRDPSQNEVDYAHERGEGLEIPLVVLINGGSASASEIVAGAIKDHSRGILVGSKSFGKGTVQSVISLEDGTAIALTTAEYLTPSGVSIENKGIKPSVEVEAFKASEEEERILDELRGSELIAEFLIEHPSWEEEDLTSLISELEKKGIEVEETLLKRFLREADDNEKNDILNDLQLLEAIKQARGLLSESKNRI